LFVAIYKVSLLKNSKRQKMSLIQFFKSKTFLKQLVFAFVGLLVFSFVVVKWLNIQQIMIKK